MSDDNNDDYPFNNFKGSGNWKYKATKVDAEETKNTTGAAEAPEKPIKCELKDGFKPWPMCP